MMDSLPQGDVKLHTMKIFKYFKPRPAESLIETLAAITVIVIATTSAMVLIRTSLMGNEVIGEKLVAMNLALESIEAVKNVRDTNYLNFASDAENCWNKLGITDVADCATAGSRLTISDGDEMVLERNFDDTDGKMMGWNLQTVGGLQTGQVSLYNYWVDVDDDGNYEDVPFYAQGGLHRSNPGLGLTTVEEDAFTRVLSFYYPDGDGSDSFEVTSTVTWADLDGDEHSISLTRTIANVY